MKNVNRVLSTYSSDLFGVCSALYELGGMTVMHDASGCNSTYSTHDEPRWYSMESMVYISALSEMEAVLGDDEKILNDITQTARELHPKFIAIGGTPIPMMMGTDFKGLARVLEKRTGISSFGFATNGLHTYEEGASMALAAIAERFCTAQACGNAKISNGVNILGATPLDFSINKNVEKLQEILKDHGFQVVSTFAMGDTLEQLSRAGCASVNLVISQTGLGAAKVLKKRFGIPYVVGIPMGEYGTKMLIEKLWAAAGCEADKLNAKETGTTQTDGLEAAVPEAAGTGGTTSSAQTDSVIKSADAIGYPDSLPSASTRILLIGEPVHTASLYNYLNKERGYTNIRIICSLLGAASELTDGLPLMVTDEESVIEAEMAQASYVIADPLYRRLLHCDSETRLLEMPHEAFSGRMYHKQMNVFIGNGIKNCIPL